MRNNLIFGILHHVDFKYICPGLKQKSKHHISGKRSAAVLRVGSNVTTCSVGPSDTASLHISATPCLSWYSTIWYREWAACWLWGWWRHVAGRAVANFWKDLQGRALKVKTLRSF